MFVTSENQTYEVIKVKLPLRVNEFECIKRSRIFPGGTTDLITEVNSLQLFAETTN